MMSLYHVLRGTVAGNLPVYLCHNPLNTLSPVVAPPQENTVLELAPPAPSRSHSRVGRVAGKQKILCVLKVFDPCLGWGTFVCPVESPQVDGLTTDSSWTYAPNPGHVLNTSAPGICPLSLPHQKAVLWASLGMQLDCLPALWTWAAPSWQRKAERPLSPELPHLCWPSCP